MTYQVRFKRWKQEHVYLKLSGLQNTVWPFTLIPNAEFAEKFTRLEYAEAAIDQIAKLNVPKRVIDFDLGTLFLIRLFGNECDDQCEGMLIDMDSDIKAQILNEQQEVIKTTRLLNPIWEKLRSLNPSWERHHA